MARILVVDDSKLMRATLKAKLTQMGHEVVGEGVNGLEAYDMYIALKPDLVTLDITMPLVDGIRALEKIRAFDGNAKVIMITSNAQKDKLMEAITLGSCGYIMKTFRETELEETVRNALL